VIVHALVLAAALSLGRAESFSILAGSGVRASGPMRVTGNVGAGSGGVTGLTPAVGDILPSGDALKDVAGAWDALASQQCVAPVHCLSSITYAFNGGADDVWIIQIDGDLIIPPGSSMKLLGGAKSSNVFWRVNGSATLGERSSFVGTLIALRSITVQEGVTVSGRLIARQGTVTLTTDDVNFCCEPIELSALPNGSVNAQYDETIAATGGTEQYTFSLFAGSLPRDLELATTGRLFGIPTAPGSYTFIVLAKDFKGCSSIHTDTIVICGTTTVSPNSLPDAVAGSAYSVLITTSGGGVHVFTTTPLPDGLALTPTSCTPQALLCGTPKAAGEYHFTITATACDGTCSGRRDYTLKVVCPVITVLPPTLDAGTVGTLYQKLITASGSLEPYTFSAGPSTPPGVTVDSSGLLSFTPTMNEPYSVTIKATDSHGCSGTRTYTIPVCPVITIFPESLPTDVTSVQLNAAPPGFYKFSGPAPPTPVALTEAGLLDWSKTPEGDYSFTVIATDASGCFGKRTYELFVCPTIMISPTTLSRGTVLVHYSKVITITGGSPPYAVIPQTAGPLMLTPHITNGMVTISGTPMAAGIIDFTVIATDSNGCVGKQTYHIAIDPPLVPGPVIPTLSEWMLAMLAIALASLAMIRRSG